jgi:hypothetical protein
VPGSASTVSAHAFRGSGRLLRVEDRTQRVAELLHEAGETHHLVYQIVDGEDADWASWYSDWLINLSELPKLLAAAPVRSELVSLLVQLDRDYTLAATDVAWPQWYAERIVQRWANSSS